MALLDPQFASSGTIRSQVVGEQSTGTETVFLQQLSHDFHRGMFVSVRVDQHIEDLAFGVVKECPVWYSEV
jgi:hypothetical protein